MDAIQAFLLSQTNSEVKSSIELIDVMIQSAVDAKQPLVHCNVEQATSEIISAFYRAKRYHVKKTPQGLTIDWSFLKQSESQPKNFSVCGSAGDRSVTFF